MNAMRDFASEFQQFRALYAELRKELARIVDIDSQESHALVNAILQNRGCLDRIIQMNAAVSELSQAWQESRTRCPLTVQYSIDKCAEEAKTEATLLHELCCVQTQKIQSTYDRLGQALGELKKGARFINSLKPPRENYPKFIDSMY